MDRNLPMVEIFSASGMEEMDINIKEMVGNLFPEEEETEKGEGSGGPPGSLPGGGSEVDRHGLCHQTGDREGRAIRDHLSRRDR